MGDVKLTRDARDILGQSPIGMLALRAGRFPLVNPAVFSFASGSIWMTTSRYAAKTLMARRDPRAAFLVDGGSRALLLFNAGPVAATLIADVRRIGLPHGRSRGGGRRRYVVRDLYAHRSWSTDGPIRLPVRAYDVAMLRVRAR